MKKYLIFFLCSFGVIAMAEAKKRGDAVDYNTFDVGGIPAPVPWDIEASATCPYDDYDLQQAATYAYHYYNDLYWTAKSGYEEWGWAWNTTRNWLQREMYSRWQADNPGVDIEG